MFVSIFRCLKGYLRIKVIGYSPERFINTCSFHNIYIWNITPCFNSYEMNIYASDFKKLKSIIRKTGTKVCIINKYGFPFFLIRNQKRKVFLSGFLISIFLISWFSTYTWKINFIGNQRYSDAILLEFLNQKGIHSGMKRNDIECSQIVKDIRKKYKDIVWVSASIEGCKLKIRIKENENIQFNTLEKNSSDYKNGTDLVASENGVIKQIITRSGTPLVKEGDSVEKGDILVSGMIPIYNDSGEITDYRLEQSDADIIEEYKIDYFDSISLTKEVKKYYDLDSKSFYFHIRDYFFFIGSSNNNKQSEIKSNYTTTSFEKIYLCPIDFCMNVSTPYQSDSIMLNNDEIKMKLSISFQNFCNNQEKKGVEIIQNNVKIYKEDKLAIAKGKITLRAAVGKEKKTTITEELLNGNE